MRDSDTVINLINYALMIITIGLLLYLLLAPLVASALISSVAWNQPVI